jgi:hypothetical protein
VSIINEALKKAQQNFDRQKKTQVNSKTDAPAPSSPETAGKEDKKEKSIWLWVATVIVFIGFLGCALVFAFLISSRNQPVQTSSGNNNPPPQKSILARLLSSSNKNNNAIVLNGIISTGSEQLALINNQIFKAGDYVGNKRILSISAEKVELFDRGKITVLKTK